LVDRTPTYTHEFKKTTTITFKITLLSYLPTTSSSDQAATYHSLRRYVPLIIFFLLSKSSSSMARVIAGPPCLRPTKQRFDLRNGEAACLRECSGLSFGSSLRVKQRSRAWCTAQSRSATFALTVA